MNCLEGIEFREPNTEWQAKQGGETEKGWGLGRNKWGYC